jgi:hypothetical protein
LYASLADAVSWLWEVYHEAHAKWQAINSRFGAVADSWAGALTHTWS